jgi:hypothetical protein
MLAHPFQQSAKVEASYSELRESGTLLAPSGDELLWVTLSMWPDGGWQIKVRRQPATLPCR